jgi:hypothetical protein
MIHLNCVCFTLFRPAHNKIKLVEILGKGFMKNKVVPLILVVVEVLVVLLFVVEVIVVLLVVDALLSLHC